MNRILDTRILTFAVLIALWAAGEAANIEPPQPSQLPSLAVPYAVATPVLEAGRDDASWNSAAVIQNLPLSLEPESKELKPFPTEVRLLWNEKFLYVRFICWGGDSYSPFDGRDAPHYLGDVVEIFLDPKGDSRQYFELQVSPRNSVFDQTILLTSEPWSDKYLRLVDEVRLRDFWAFPIWNMEGLRTATSRLQTNGAESGWIADLAIPAKATLKRLGLQSFEPMMLRANLLRYDWVKTNDPKQPRRLVSMNWSPVLYGNPHTSPRAMGYLKLMPKSLPDAEKR